MYFIIVESDQLVTWSDDTSEPIHRRFAEAPHRSLATVSFTPSAPPRFSHRAIQAMRQARMQMRRRPRPWPQVLSVGQLPGFAAANGLRSARVLCSNGRVSGQLSPITRDPRVDLRDQPRTAAPPRGVLKARCAQGAFCPPHVDRCEIGRRSSCQYACSLARRQSKGFACWGDN
jgi:hypothetical protein